MKTILKHFKPFDYLLIGLAVSLSFLPPIMTLMTHQSHHNQETIAIIKIKGKVIDEFNLSTTEHLIKTYHPDKGQYNTIEIQHGKIRVKEDNSPDQIAVKTGWIKQQGDILVCLPHQLLIEIVGEETDDDLILPL